MIRQRLFKKSISLFKKDAQHYSTNKEDAGKLLGKAGIKAKKNETTLKGVWTNLQTLFQMIKAWISGDYRQIPTRSLLIIFAAIAYFVSPIDLMPDFIFGFGLLDDVAVLTFAFKQIEHDLEAFKLWKQKGEQLNNHY
ncbi:YkvA family protein [Peribacillus loiseleuriae]|uniref:YkvA family protein n=1 Tax=Peribacillus loiseleuriae TaxID=1679170 RepID=UPI0037F500F9